MASIKDLELDINPIKKATSEHQIEHWFESLFDDLELTYQPQQRILQGKPDCLIGDIIIDFKYNVNEQQLNEWINSKGDQYVQEYFNIRGKNPSLLIVISEEFISYFDKDLVLKNKREIGKQSIISLIECLFAPKEINSEQFAILFGANSPLYILSYARLEKHFDDRKSEKSICFQQWKKHFRLAYHDEEVGKELFLKHSYLSMLLKLILYKEFINPEEYSREYFKDLENYFERKGISLFHYDFFRWVINVQELCDNMFDKLKTMTFKATDIFRAIYQEMITAGVRHTLGEYYTPEILCKKMVEKSYVVGDRVLDSSCGSGTFLIEICKKIDSYFKVEDKSKPPEQWFKAINNIFGFDINPIAILTTKANLILYFKNKKQYLEDISINIYLCNSIDPIEFSPVADIELGSFYNFCVDLLDNQLELRIPGDALSKTNIKAFQKIIKSIYNVWEEFDKFEDIWEATIERLPDDVKSSFVNSKLGSSKAIENFFRKLHSLKLQDKDHIWLYILNNLVGIRSLLLKQKMDLIITNPPWLTYKDADPNLQANMKKIFDQFDILPGAKDVTNIEEAIVFLYKIPDLYLKKNEKGKVAFVMPRSLLVSSQNDKARRFDYFFDIEFFEFNDLIFNIDCCCIFASYTENPAEKEAVIEKYPIICHYFDSKTMGLIEDFSIEPYVYFQEKKNQKYLVKRLIRSDKIENLLPLTMSDYYNNFLQGADLIPKCLLHCIILEKTHDGKITTIESWISPKAKKPWNKAYFKPQRVESENIFYATLSRELYPFYIKPLPIFLPLDKNFEYKVTNIGPFSRKHWNFIKEVYFKETKKDLFEVGINYRNKLCTNKKVKGAQRKPFKVIFPTSKNLIGAVISDPEGRFFIDSTIYYYGTEDEDEAYYLCGMFNVPNLFKSVKVIADTRHHHKKPLYFNIPKFINDDNQLQISRLSKQCSEIVEDYVSNVKKIELGVINNLIKENLDKIQSLGIKILTSKEGKKIIKEYELET